MLNTETTPTEFQPLPLRHPKPNISTMISQISSAIVRSLELDRNPKRGVDAPGAQGTRVRVRNIDAAPQAL